MQRGARLSALAIAATIAAAALAGTAGGAAPASERLSERVPARISAADVLERPLLFLINRVRRQHDLVPLRLRESLGRAAERHGRSMAINGYFAHDSLSGASVRDRVSRFDRSLRGGRGIVGEVLLWRSPAPSPFEALAMWLRSPSHRAVLLDARYRTIGLEAVAAWRAPGVFRGLDVTIVAADLAG